MLRKWKRYQLYRLYREARRERDYQAGIIQYANRPFTGKSIFGKPLTTKRFFTEYSGHIIAGPILREIKRMKQGT